MPLAALLPSQLTKAIPGTVGFVLPAKKTATHQLYMWGLQAWFLWVPRMALSIIWGLEELCFALALLKPQGWFLC